MFIPSPLQSLLPLPKLPLRTFGPISFRSSILRDPTSTIRRWPSSSSTYTRSMPPLFDILIMLLPGRVQHGAKTTPEFRIDKSARSFPFEIFIVQGLIFRQLMQICCQIGWSPKIIHMNEGMRRSNACIVGFFGTHNDRNDIMPEMEVIVILVG